MNISICITVLNEEAPISRLLRALLSQTKRAGEIIIVDGGSTDKTVEIIKHFQKKDKRIRLLREKCSRARGRNLSVEVAQGEIIAMTDAGCLPRKDWLEKLIISFTAGAEVVAGFYQMTGDSAFQKAVAVFLGVLPSQFGPDFLPSTRSIAFRKEVWEKVGGFPETLTGTAEDTVFNYKILKAGIRISRVKEAIVEWGMPDTISDFQSKIFNYAKGDAQSKIFFFPSRGFTSHNLHALLIMIRYFLGLFLLIFSIFHPAILVLPVLLVVLYLFLAFRKAGFWGIILQFVSDFAVMAGFLYGLLVKNGTV